MRVLITFYFILLGLLFPARTAAITPMAGRKAMRSPDAMQWNPGELAHDSNAPGFRIRCIRATKLRLIGFLSFIVLSSQAFAVNYTVTDLGTFGGTTNYVADINNSGQVVGYSYSWSPTSRTGYVTRAYLYSNGSMITLGTLGGTNSAALGINNAGQVVGYSQLAGDVYSHAFLYSNGKMTDLGTLGGSNSTAASINDNGQIVGNSYTSLNHIRAFLYANGSMQDIGTLGGLESSASRINNAGQIVGSSGTTSIYGAQAFVYSNGMMSPIGPLGALSSSGSSASGINSAGQVVGGQSHAFLYSNGNITDLGTLGGAFSGAADINNQGQIVGQANGVGPGNGIPYAFLYSNGSMINLAGTQLPSGGYLYTATGINDAGQIVATDNMGHAYILTPAATIAQGWNLLGNSINAPLDVTTAFSDTTKVSTVWKWVPATSKWAFYTPAQTDGGAAYAVTKGYDFLTTINGGEGFWVNAKTAFAAQLPAGTAINSNTFADKLPLPNGLPAGWSLISVGDNSSPRNFANAIAISQPVSPAVAATSLTTLWAWDSGSSGWYFYAPNLDNNGGLANYITTKGYLDFGVKTLDPATGFWVNHP